MTANIWLPSGKVNPKAIEAMLELDYDLSTHGSKSLDELADVEFDFVATTSTA